MPIIKKYEGIGIRIEDDILVTKDGYEILSEKAPKEISEIEKVMKMKSRFDKPVYCKMIFLYNNF